MDDGTPQGFEDPGSASLWAWLLSRSDDDDAPPARAAPRAQDRGSWQSVPPPAATDPVLASAVPVDEDGRGMALVWDGRAGAVRATLVLRPDLLAPRALWDELDDMWRTLLQAIEPTRLHGVVEHPDRVPVVVEVRVLDRQLVPEVRHFLDGVRGNPGDDRIRAVEVHELASSPDDAIRVRSLDDVGALFRKDLWRR
ncbi:MAG: hypothetical protein Q7T56_16130 [Nocardioidaceae bacterium]|nr:hypothetical protein [Nocardioidaceae bacterium]